MQSFFQLFFLVPTRKTCSAVQTDHFKQKKKPPAQTPLCPVRETSHLSPLRVRVRFSRSTDNRKTREQTPPCVVPPTETAEDRKQTAINRPPQLARAAINRSSEARFSRVGRVRDGVATPTGAPGAAAAAQQVAAGGGVRLFDALGG